MMNTNRPTKLSSVVDEEAAVTTSTSICFRNNNRRGSNDGGVDISSLPVLPVEERRKIKRSVQMIRMCCGTLAMSCAMLGLVTRLMTTTNNNIPIMISPTNTNGSYLLQQNLLQNQESYSVADGGLPPSSFLTSSSLQYHVTPKVESITISSPVTNTAGEGLFKQDDSINQELITVSTAAEDEEDNVTRRRRDQQQELKRNERQQERREERINIIKEERKLERQQQLRHEERMMWYQTDVSHLYEEFVNMKTDNSEENINTSIKPFLWATSHSGGYEILKVIKECYHLNNIMEMNTHFFHSLHGGKWNPSLEERNDINMYHVATDSSPSSSSSLSSLLHEAVNTLYRASPPIQTRWIVSFTHPMERLHKVFQQHPLSSTLSVEEYINIPDIVSQYDNVMVREIIGNKPWPTILTYDDLQIAINVIETKVFMLFNIQDPYISFQHLRQLLLSSSKQQESDIEQCEYLETTSLHHQAERKYDVDNNIDATHEILTSSKQLPSYMSTFASVHDQIKHHVRFDLALYKRMLELYEEQKERYSSSSSSSST